MAKEQQSKRKKTGEKIWEKIKIEKETMAWLCKNLLLPLMPFLVGTIIRYILQGELKLSIFDPTELSFSMAMLCSIVISQSSKLSDRDLADSLYSLYAVAMAIFITLFAVSLFIKLSNDSEVLNCVEDTRNCLLTGGKSSDVLSKLSTSHIDSNVLMFGRIRFATFILSFPIVIFAIVCKSRYKLGD